MPRPGFEPMRVWDFAETVAGCTTTDAVRRMFARDVADAGFVSSACRASSRTGGRGAHAYFRDWPREWEAISTQQRIPERSPIMATVRRTLHPFSWREIQHPSFDDSLDARHCWSVARDWGWSDGFVVPVHGPGGYVACVSMATRENGILLDPVTRGRLHMMAVLVHERCRALGDDTDLRDPRMLLTARELECARWIAAGKTNGETGMILGISALTVRFHMDNVRKKLGLYSRSQVAAHLALCGLL